MLTVLFYGTMWGMAEAVVGGLLHALRFQLTGSIMMGIGMFCISSCIIREREHVSGCLGVGVIAAALKMLSIPLYYRTLVFKSIAHPVISILSETLITVIIISYAYKLISGSSQNQLRKSALIAGAGLMVGLSTHFVNTAFYTMLNPLFTPKSAVTTGLFCGIGAWFALSHVLHERMSRKYYIYGSVINLVAVLIYYGACFMKVL